MNNVTPVKSEGRFGEKRPKKLWKVDFDNIFTG